MLFGGEDGAAAAWSPRQIHDTVAAIAAQARYAAKQETLFGRFVRYVFEKLAVLFDRLGRGLDGRMDARAVAYTFVAIIVLAVAARVLVERRAADGGRRKRTRANRAGTRIDHFRDAQSAAAAGRYLDASHALYAAVIEALAAEGAIRAHASKTSGDYAYELRRVSFGRFAEYRAFVRAFDRAVFGTFDLTAGEYSVLHEAAGRVVSAGTVA